VSFLAVQTLTTSVNATVRSVYTRIAAQVEVDGGEQTSYTGLREQLGGYSNVKRVERYGLMGANTIWGRLVVWGFEPDTHIYQYQLVRGRWFQAGETDVVLISASFARKSGLRVGSVLEATNPVNGRAASWRVIGIVQQPLDSMGLVGAAVLPVNTLYAFQGASAERVPDAAYRMLIQVKDPSPTAVDALTNQVGELARASLVTGSPDKEGEITNVFLVQNEARRHQLNWLITFGLLAGVAVIVGCAAVLGLANEQAGAQVAPFLEQPSPDREALQYLAAVPLFSALKQADTHLALVMILDRSGQALASGACTQPQLLASSSQACFTTAAQLAASLQALPAVQDAIQGALSGSREAVRVTSVAVDGNTVLTVPVTGGQKQLAGVLLAAFNGSLNLSPPPALRIRDLARAYWER
jgi:hypothetical protein